MRKKITITKPYVKEYDDKARLESIIKGTDFEKSFYFEVDIKYKKFLCYERSDAFLMGLMYFALVNEYDIVCEAPLSEKLYYQLTDAYIPTVVKNDPEMFNHITITAELDSKPIKNEGAVGASVSGGVDSFYTIVKNLNRQTASYNITHLVLTNCFNIYFDDDDTRKRFEELSVSGEKIANELGLPFIKIYTNEHMFWFPHFVNLYCMRYCALPYALQKLFAVYDYSSSFQFDEFSFVSGNKSSSHYDSFSVHLISDENLTIYSSGGEASRAEKAEYIADNVVVQNNLQVCNMQHDNCSVCEKCLRTMFNFYACNKLEHFGNVFDLEQFYKNKNSVLVEMLARKGDYDKETLNMMKKNGVLIPFRVKRMGEIKHLVFMIKQQLKKIKLVYYIVKKVKSNSDSIVNKSERYNLDHDFAKRCDPNII